uniref:Uncharacterized protein n=1 Tax=Geospiza parvula TaxID=87175 RepID=A0A8C3Q9M6_GEOPR
QTKRLHFILLLRIKCLPIAVQSHPEVCSSTGSEGRTGGSQRAQGSPAASPGTTELPNP